MVNSMLNPTLIRRCATELEKVLAKYAEIDSEAQALRSSLEDLISKAKDGNLSTPVEFKKVPGGFWFNEGGLRDYPDLEKAYVDFKWEIAGGKSDKTDRLLAEIDRLKRSNVKKT